jgi:hypothetical protein
VRSTLKTHNVARIYLGSDGTAQACGLRNVFIDVIAVGVQGQRMCYVPTNFDNCMKYIRRQTTSWRTYAIIVKLNASNGGYAGTIRCRSRGSARR